MCAECMTAGSRDEALRQRLARVGDATTDMPNGERRLIFRHEVEMWDEQHGERDKP